MERIRNFLVDESGATAVEYAFIIALIAGAIVLALTTLGINLVPPFSRMGDTVGTAS